jgi:hypothetical protein
VFQASKFEHAKIGNTLLRQTMSATYNIGIYNERIEQVSLFYLTFVTHFAKLFLAISLIGIIKFRHLASPHKKKDE